MRSLLRIFLLSGILLLSTTIAVTLSRQQEPKPIVWAMMVERSDQVRNANTFSIIHFSPDAQHSRSLATLPIDQYGAFSQGNFLWTPDNEWLWYEDQRDQTNLTMQRIDYFGHHAEALEDIYSNGALYDLVWSPDGEWGVLPMADPDTGAQYLYRVRPDGSDLTPIAENYPVSVDLNTFWSSDSQHVLFVSKTNQRRTDVYHLNRADWRFEHVEAIVGGLIWLQQSPDAANVAIVAIQPRASRHDVYSVATDGTQVRLHVESGPLVHDLQWADNQRFTAFHSYYQGNREISLVVNIERQTHLYMSFKDFPTSQYATWSPDNRYFVSYTRPVNTGQNMVNLVSTTDRSQRWPINEPQDCQQIYSPVWSPSGRWLLFSDVWDGKCVLTQMEYNGSAASPLWDITGDYRILPNLSPPNRDWIVVDNTNYSDPPDHRLFDLETGKRLKLPQNHLIIGWTESQIKAQTYPLVAILGGVLFCVGGLGIVVQIRNATK